jgi:hypothetical protein
VTTQPLTLAEVTQRAIAILSRELGPADTLRFVGQFWSGAGDYTTERDQLFAGETLDRIVADIKKSRGG